MKKILFFWVLVFLSVGSGGFLCAGNENWRDDFDRICAHTADVDKLSSEELDGLIVESGELLQIVESSDDPEKKIYLIRLKKCRNFFIFMKGIAENSADN
ncbi:MAG: hypothetical protein ABFS18_02715 [Thermodesulfobacteriota bacterium]